MADFNLHAPVGATKQRRRVGRGQGSGLGTTAGRGNKGQQSRSGGRTYAGFEGGQMPLYRRIPHRGFTNIFAKEWQVVNLDLIEAHFLAGETVNAETLAERGLVKRSDRLIKILAEGNLTKALTVAVDKTSVAAAEKISKAGGKVEVPAPRAPRGRTQKKAKA